MASLVLPSLRETPEVKELLELLSAPGLQTQHKEYNGVVFDNVEQAARDGYLPYPAAFK